jgi:hypothetical protein
LFLTSLGFQNIGIILLCIAYGRYASSGTSLGTVKLIGKWGKWLPVRISIMYVEEKLI